MNTKSFLASCLAVVAVVASTLGGTGCAARMEDAPEAEATASTSEALVMANCSSKGGGYYDCVNRSHHWLIGHYPVVEDMLTLAERADITNVGDQPARLGLMQGSRLDTWVTLQPGEKWTAGPYDTELWSYSTFGVYADKGTAAGTLHLAVHVYQPSHACTCERNGSQKGWCEELMVESSCTSDCGCQAGRVCQAGQCVGTPRTTRAACESSCTNTFYGAIKTCSLAGGGTGMGAGARSACVYGRVLATYECLGSCAGLPE